MPISDRHSCVFIHIPRTGGTTLEKLLGLHRDWPTLDLSRFRGKLDREDDFYQLQHLPYEEMGRIADIAHTRAYFKFTFVRNPWERLVSEYFWLHMQDEMSFSDFVDRVAVIVHERQKIKGENCHFRPQTEFLSDDLDHVARFENYAEEAARILDRLGLEDARIGHQYRTDHEHYAKYYDNRLAAAVAEIYRKDIDALGYRFGA